MGSTQGPNKQTHGHFSTSAQLEHVQIKTFSVEHCPMEDMLALEDLPHINLDT